MNLIFLRRKALGGGSIRGMVAFLDEVEPDSVSVLCHDKGKTKVIRNDRLNKLNFDKDDVVVRWGCTSTVPVKNVLNKASAIHLVGDKERFRRHLMGHPATYPSTPKTVFTEADAKRMIDDGLSLFIRPRHHAQGKNVFVAHTHLQLLSALKQCGEGWYASEFVKKTAEYRVFVAQGKAVWVAEKTPENPDDPAWNVAQGGRFDNVRWDNWPLHVVDAAVKAFEQSGLDFGGVDVMVDDEDKALTIEINSAPSQTSPYRQSCTAKVLQYMLEEGKDLIPTNYNVKGWRRYVHPAIWTKKG